MDRRTTANTALAKRCAIKTKTYVIQMSTAFNRNKIWLQFLCSCKIFVVIYLGVIVPKTLFRTV